MTRVLMGFVVLALAGCTSATPTPGTPAPASGQSWADQSRGSQPGARGTPAPGTRSGGWTVTVYYTAVESLHSGTPVRVTGCPRLDCAHGHADLGTYPDDFVTAVKNEGTGRTSDGRYLNWSSDTGYWLDSAPRDSYGGVLRPYGSAAADPNVLPRGTPFMIVDCGHDQGGGAIAAPVCAKLRAAHWSVTDEFTPGLGGAHHLDAYLGEETGPHFTDGPWFVTLTGAVLLLRA